MAWLARLRANLEPFVLIADPDLIAARLSDAAIAAPVERVTRPEQAAATFSKVLPVLAPGPCVQTYAGGKPAPANADSTIAAIDMAVRLALSGAARAVVTNPIAKSVLNAAGFGFPGHTEYLGALAARQGHAACPVMMLCGGGLRAVPVTIHMALRDVPASLSPGKIVEIARMTHRALIQDFGVAAPRLAVTGLNPHAGEDGTMGTEERDIIIPAIAQLRAQGIDATGPLPADTAFRPAARAQSDAVIAMYHDQALIPIKTLAFDEGVNVTLGLPFVRTSPDHGTAFDIAGTGAAAPDSLIAALRMAGEIARTRASVKGGTPA
jgi:4-hydroxythreonine-4-phosphate dehydrogenase